MSEQFIEAAAPESTSAAAPSAACPPASPKPRDRRVFNAYRHGLAGHVLVILPADEVAYKHHCQSMVDSFAPVGAFEADLAQQIADDRWRLKRIVAIESNLFADGQDRPDRITTGHEQIDAAFATSRTWDERKHDLALLTLYAGRIQRSVEKNHALLRQAQQDRRAALQQIVAEAAILPETYEFPEEALPPQFVRSRPPIARLAAHHRRLQEARTALAPRPAPRFLPRHAPPAPLRPRANGVS